MKGNPENSHASGAAHYATLCSHTEKKGSKKFEPSVKVKKKKLETERCCATIEDRFLICINSMQISFTTATLDGQRWSPQIAFSTQLWRVYWEAGRDWSQVAEDAPFLENPFFLRLLVFLKGFRFVGISRVQQCRDCYCALYWLWRVRMMLVVSVDQTICFKEFYSIEFNRFKEIFVCKL